MDRALIEEYENGGAEFRKAVYRLNREDLLAFPVPGTWSIQQIAIHLLDSEVVFVDRMKRLIAEENPPLVAYDENKFTKNLFYDEQSIDDAATIIEANRRNFTRVLRKLPDAAFERVGTHSERGPQKLSDVLGYAVGHMKHHLKFIAEKRGILKK